MIDRHTVFIRNDNMPRDGCDCIATAEVVRGDGSIAYMGEVRGRVAVADALHVGYLHSTHTAWTWAASKGYTRPRVTPPLFQQ